ncbi:bcl-2-related protein A1 [Eublepharis macularius]|uniref:Bcl-2-related protein A1 n=1 Tax=Eublepharis macularius TaxID=481883 RepID=A0AA97LKT7_EUBMA|nr:bcl-2-related protein A1 [Eublepharis macularius]
MDRCDFLFVYNLVQDYLKYVCLDSEPETASNQASQVLRKVASSLQGEVEENLGPYLDKFEICSTEEAGRVFDQVMVNEFTDGNTNWGRILTIFLFGGILAKKLQERGVLFTADTLKQISHFITDYIINTHSKWIVENGGWDNGFVAKFEDKSPWLSLHWMKTKILAAFSFVNQYY